jgi:hypothetical protein
MDDKEESKENPAGQRQLDLIETSLEMQETSAVDAGELGFGAKCLVAGCLPYRKPKGADLINGCWVRTNGEYSLEIQGGSEGLPYGSYPRIFSIWLTCEAVKRKSREISAGNSFRGFCRKLGVDTSMGKRGAARLLREQIDRFLSSRVAFRRETETSKRKRTVQFADDYELFWDPHENRHNQFFESFIMLSQPFFDEITQHHIPLDLRAVARLKQAPLALDAYQWLAYRYAYLKKPSQPTWEQLSLQFGSNCARPRKFKESFAEVLRTVKTVYPQARFEVSDKGLLLLPSPTPIPKLQVVKP